MKTPKFYSFCAKKSWCLPVAILASLGSASCSHRETQPPVENGAVAVRSGSYDPFSEEAFRENLPKARSGDPKAMVVLVNYYLERDRHEQAEHWKQRIREFYLKKDGRWGQLHATSQQGHSR
jgi:hypothetical protein